MRLILVYGGGNDLGRAYCLWLLSQHLGWETTTFAVKPDWPPLEGTGFAALPIQQLTADTMAKADVVVVYQPMPRTLGRVWPMIQATKTPALVDVDDPHWEGAYGHTRARRLRVIAGMVRRGRSPLPPYLARHRALRSQIITASPFVQDRWPGSLIPHVREEVPASPLLDGPLRVAFVGSPRRHKGLEAIRDAVDAVEGVRLYITAPRPPDARRNEIWLGMTTLDAGRAVLQASHVSAVLQEDSYWTHRQFPVKVVDAMMAGRVVLGSDVPPIRWATGGNASLVKPGNHVDLVAALKRARDDREDLAHTAAAARVEALSRFTPAVVAPAFRSAVERAVGR